MTVATVATRPISDGAGVHPRTVGILGGMGPAAGAEFVRLFVRACEAWLQQRGRAVTDQAFPEHWLAQLPLPDRTAALLQGGAPPLADMAGALQRLAGLGARTVAIACNTAHAWHADLQRGCPGLELLHIVDETTQHLQRHGVRRIGLMATQGTHGTGLYETALLAAGIECHVPTPDEQALVMRGILHGVKAGRLPLAEACFRDVADRLVRRHGLATLVLACTEIPLALHALPAHAGVGLLDPAAVLAKALATRAFGQPGGEL